MVGLIIAFTPLFLAATWLRKTYTERVPKDPELSFRRSGSAAFRSFSYSTTLTAIDQSVVFTGARATTATLPDARACAGRVYSISNYSNSTPTPIVTITPQRLQFIEGQSYCSLWLTDQSVTLISDGANWKILRQFIPSPNSLPNTQKGSITYLDVSAKKGRPQAVFYDISGN
ncbi:MAG TPA: hypothetical protein VGN00_27490 [Puia sp.]